MDSQVKKGKALCLNEDSCLQSGIFEDGLMEDDEKEKYEQMRREDIDDGEEGEGVESSGSNIVDAFSEVDPVLRRQVSMEVNEEARKEEKMQDVIANSKLVQYSNQGGSTFRMEKKQSSTKKRKSPSKQQATKNDNGYRIVPFCLANMEILLRKGQNLDRKEMGVQTESVNWYLMIKKEN